jgi:hypothetical protein
MPMHLRQQNDASPNSASDDIWSGADLSSGFIDETEVFQYSNDQSSLVLNS